MARAACVAAVVLAGAVLVLPRLGAQSLWLDESLTVGPVLAAGDAKDLVHRARAEDTTPPGSHLVLYALRRFVPPTEFHLRLPSWIGIEVGLLILGVAAARLWGSSTGLLVLAIGQTSPFLAFYSMEARNYGLWFPFIAGALLIQLRWFESLSCGSWARPALWGAAFGLVTGIGCWIHPMQASLFAGQILVAAAVAAGAAGARRRMLAVTLGIAALVAVAVLAPWIVEAAGRGAFGKGVGWTRDFSWSHPGYLAYAAAFGFSWGPDLRELHRLVLGDIVRAYPASVGLAVLGLVLLAGVAARRMVAVSRDPERRWELLVWLALPAGSLAGPLVLAAATDFPLHARHLLFAWPLLPALLAVALRQGGAARGVAASVLLVQALSLGNLLFDPRYGKDEQREAVRFAEERSGGKAYVLAEGNVARYYSRTSRGVDKGFIDFDADATDVWLLHTREWEPANQRDLEQLQGTLRDAGFVRRGTYEQFRGVRLMHWTPARRL